MRRYLVLLLTVLMQYGIAQNPLIDKNNSIIQAETVPTQHIETQKITNIIFTNDRYEDVKINIPYISNKEIILKYHPLLSEDFRLTYPDIRVYKWRNAESNGVLSISSESLYISKIDASGTSMLYPINEKKDEYALSTSKDAYKDYSGQYCQAIPTRAELDQLETIAQTATTRALITNGTKLRTYRLAPIVTGEYYQANGNTNSSVAMHLAQGVATMEAIFENEIAVNFTLLTPVLFSNPNTDPFTPDIGGTGRVDQAIDAVTAQFNSANYDFGHVFHHHETDDGWSTGGVAGLGVVCQNQNNRKAGGWSGSFNNNGIGWILLACHEIGHMFSAQHTFNGEGESCDDAISEDTAYEIGSGTTIMSYQGICGAGQNIASSGEADGYFHAHSLIQMVNYMEVFGGCANETNTNNDPPNITINPCNETYQIPRGTPFVLSAEGSDPDGNPVTYTWEQYDEDGPTNTSTQGEIGNAAAGNIVGPLFRSFPPSSDISRSFPDRATVLAGNASDPFQVLPAVARDLNFKLTARDNQIGGGAIAIEDRYVEVLNNGPFRVTNPNNATSIIAGNSLNITWSTGGSDDVCSVVDIYLSIDGGYSTPFLLANDVAYNSESATVNIPNSISSTTNARIMIICDDNPCVQIFDFSNNDFTIESSCNAYQSYICDTEPVEANQGDAILDLMMSSVNGEITNSLLSNTITNASPTMPIAVYDPVGSSCSVVLNNYFFASDIITPTASGDYIFSIDIEYDDGFGFISIFDEASFNENSPCSSFITSSGTNTSGNGVSASPTVVASLDACTKYVIIYYNYAAAFPANTSISNISGPGEILQGEGIENVDYAYTYVAVNTNTEFISATSPTGDFRTLGGGEYEIYGVSYKTGGPTPPANTDPSTWIGQSITALIFSGNCVLSSQNLKPMTIISSCSIDQVEANTQSACDPITNEYSQDLFISYSSSPNTGNIIINGSSFPIISSPQGIQLDNLLSDGLPVDLTVSFSDDDSCETIFPAAFTAPENCCPIDLELGDDQTACISDMLVLDAGPDGVSYEWTINDNALADQTRQITPLATGIYKVTVTNADGCAKSDEVMLIINPNPEILLDENSSQCEGQLATLNPMIGNPDYTYTWTRNGDFVAGTEIIDVSIPGEYCIEVTNTFSNCSTTACTTVEFIDAPNVDLGSDQSGCVGDEFILDAGMDGSSYEWLLNGTAIDDEISSTLVATANGIYVASVSEGLCTTFDTVVVNLSENPTINFEISDSFTLCEESTESTNISGFFDDYNIFRDNELVASGVDPSFIITEPGQYIIVASNSAGCAASDTTTAIGSPLPIVDLGEDKLGCIGSDVILNAGDDGSEYIWFLGTDLLDESESSITVDQSGEYSVIVSSESFCSTMDTVMVEFSPGPSLDIGESFTLCEGNSQVVTATTSGDNIKWYRDGIELTGENEFMLEVSQSGTYLAEVEGSSGCKVEAQITVEVFPNPIVDLGEDRTICEGEMTTIIAGDNTNGYLWTDSNGMTVSQSAELTTGTAGVYTVFVTAPNSCLVSSQIEIILTEIPMVTLDQSIEYCAGSSVILDAQGEADNYTWQKDNVEIIGENDVTLEVSEPGVYTVTASNGNNCSSTTFTTVEELENPSFDLGEDVDLCPGEQITLTISENGSYQWSTSENTSSITINYDDLTENQTTISATLTTDNDCTAMDEIVITRLTNPSVSIGGEFIVCQGDTITLTAFSTDDSPTDLYQWSGPEGTFSNEVGSSIEVFPSEESTYTVTAVNACGVTMNTAMITISIDEPSSDLTAGRDTCAIQGNSIKLQATGGTSYEWIDNSSIVNGINSATPEVMPITETTYGVYITNENGCTYFDEITVCIIEDPFSLILPISLISPNDDGKNDFLEFRGLEAFPNNRLRIYNRWGAVVFDRTSYQNGEILFDGSRGIDGKLPPDTYYYILEIDDKVVFKQNLTIVRN